jgi:hypothetical protein
MKAMLCRRAALALLIVLAGCAVNRPSELRTEDIARISAVNVERSVRIRKQLDATTAKEARDLLDVGVGQDLFYMESTEGGLLNDSTYMRQRARAISLLKREWLRNPPFAMEPQTARYIEKICTEAKTCPTGDLRTQN